MPVENRWFPLGLLVIALGASACTPERTRAVRNAEAGPATEQKDYRDMLKQARARSDAEDTLGPLVRGLEVFRNERGRLPTNLAELVQSGIIKGIPAPPPGAAYAYDARNGNVRLLPVDDAGRVAVPDDTFQPPSLLNAPR